MKYFSTTILLCLLFSALPAQDYEVNWGNEYRRPGGLQSTFFLAGMTDDAYHLLMHSRRDNTLLSFDWNHKLIETKSIQFGTGRDEFFMSEFIKTQAGNFAVLAEFDRRSKQLRTFISPFANQSFGELRQIYAQPYRSGGRVSLQQTADPDSDSFERLVISPDRSKVVYTNTTDARERNRDEKIVLAVYDESFQQLWTKEEIFPYDDDDMRIIHSAVSNTGTVYLLAQIDKRFAERRQERGLPDYSYELFKITADDREQIDISLGEELAAQYAGLYLTDTEEEKVIIAGMYTDTELRSGLKGSFLVEVDANLTVNLSETSTFSSSFLENLISNRNNRRGRGLDNNYQIRTIFRFTDGKIGFVAEETFITYVTDMGTGMNGVGGRSRPRFHSDQLVVVLFDTNGQLIQTQKIEKNFSSQNLNVTSFATAVAEDELFIVYNDQKRRAERKAIRGHGGGNALFTDLTIIDGNGDIPYQASLFTSDETDRKAFVPAQSGYNNEYMVLLARTSKFYQCGLLRF